MMVILYKNLTEAYAELENLPEDASSLENKSSEDERVINWIIKNQGCL